MSSTEDRIAAGAAARVALDRGNPEVGVDGHIVRLTVNLAPTVAAALTEYAGRTGNTITDSVMHAVRALVKEGAVADEKQARRAASETFPSYWRNGYLRIPKEKQAAFIAGVRWARDDSFAIVEMPDGTVVGDGSTLATLPAEDEVTR